MFPRLLGLEREHPLARQFRQPREDATITRRLKVTTATNNTIGFTLRCIVENDTGPLARAQSGLSDVENDAWPLPVDVDAIADFQRVRVGIENRFDACELGRGGADRQEGTSGDRTRTKTQAGVDRGVLSAVVLAGAVWKGCDRRWRSPLERR